jgi:hypothetical protein
LPNPMFFTIYTKNIMHAVMTWMSIVEGILNNK